MQEDRMIEEIHNLSNEIDDLKKIIAFKNDIIEADRKIIELQRDTIAHLKMIADDRRVTINQLNEERWQVRKLESDKPAIIESTNIAERFMEGRIADDNDTIENYHDIVEDIKRWSNNNLTERET